METHFQRLSITAFLSASLWLTACVNSINQDIPTEGEIPINFSVKIEKASTKVTNNVFENTTVQLKLANRSLKLLKYSLLSGISE